MSISYKDSGVDTHKAEKILDRFSDFQKKRPKSPYLMSGIGPFASCFSLKELLSQMTDPILVTCCDGVGTKSKLASDWGDISGLGQDLVAMNVNDLICVGARPLVFLDYYACGKLNDNQLLTLLKSIQSACEMAGCDLAGGETAEMPGVYQDQDFDLGGFCVGVVDRKKMLGPEKVVPGDIVIGIESSGIHSNGYSLIRKLIESKKVAPEAQVPFGKENWKEILLKPTFIYAKTLQPIFDNLHGLAHITGEGILGNLPRVLPQNTKAVLDLNRLQFSPLFEWVKNETRLSFAEMLGTFNCGWGLMAITSPSESSTIEGYLEKAGLKTRILGTIEQSTQLEPSVEWTPS